MINMQKQNTNSHLSDGVNLVIPRLLPSITLSAKARYRNYNRVNKTNKFINNNRNKRRSSRGRKRSQLNNSKLGITHNDTTTKDFNNHEKQFDSNFRANENSNDNWNETNPLPKNSTPNIGSFENDRHTKEGNSQQESHANPPKSTIPSQNGSAFNNGNLSSDKVSQCQAGKRDGHVFQPVKRYNNVRQQMTTDVLKGGMAPSFRDPPPLLPYSQPLPGTIIRNDDDNPTVTTIENKGKGQKHLTRYPSLDGPVEKPSMLNVTSTSLGKESEWHVINKTTPRTKMVLPNGARGPPKEMKKMPSVPSFGSRCCSIYDTISENVKSKWTLLLLVHCSLFLALAFYIAVGASLLLKIDGGVRYAVRGKGEEGRVAMLRIVAADRLLNISLKAILEKSRDAVLDTIFMSDEMQAALSAFQISRLSTLPSDHRLQLLSQNVLNMWHRRIEAVLVKYHLITTMEAHGYQLSSEELSLIWRQYINIVNPNDVYHNGEIGTLPWEMWSSSIQAFGLMTTMGIGTLSPSYSGRSFTVIYALLGIPLYSYVIIVWSERLLDALVVICKTRNASSNRKIITSESLRVPTPGWNVSPTITDPPPLKETPILLIFVSLTLTLVFIIGIGPLMCGSFNNSFGERLEAAFLSLLLVKPPSPLPKDGKTCCGFIIYVLIGHFSIIATVRSLKRAFTSSRNSEDKFSNRRM